MAERYSILPFFVLVLCSFSHGLSILHGTIECRSLCERTFPPHTYPGVNISTSCYFHLSRISSIDDYKTNTVPIAISVKVEKPKQAQTGVETIGGLTTWFVISRPYKSEANIN